jgi:hypothetical protein
MKTAMQELRDDLVATLKTGDEALNEIQDISIRESCQKVVQLTLESIIKRIDEELLEMEEEQKIKFAENCLDKALDLDIRTAFSNVEKYYNETFKQQEQ